METIASEFDIEEIWRYLLENEENIQAGHYKELITVSKYLLPSMPKDLPMII